MRIVLIGPVPPFRGGIAHYTSQLALALADGGHDLLLVSFKRQYPRWLFPGESDRDPSQHPIETIQAQFWLDSLNPLTWFATFRRIRRLQPDLLILPWWTVFWAPVWIVLGALQRSWGKGQLVMLCHNVLPHDARPWQSWVTRQVFRWADRFVVQSSAEAERLQMLMQGTKLRTKLRTKQGMTSKVRVQVVPHPVYRMIPKPDLDKAGAKARLEIDPARPVLLFFGIVRPYKGLDVLLSALPGVRAQIPDILLLVAGEFWDDVKGYQTQIQALGLGDAVRIDDRYIPNEAVALIFTAADLVVAPYRNVTGSGVIQMARGFGVPVVASGLTDTGPDIRIVPSEDPPALAAAIVAALSAPPQPDDAPPLASPDAGWDQLVDVLTQG